LRSLVTVAELGGVTQTGELLGRSQPAISLQIKKLEHTFDTLLFNRAEKRLQLTATGESLYIYAKQIVRLNDEAVAHFESPDLSGTIRFGIPSEFATTLLPKILGRFTHAYPNVTLEVTCDLSKNLLQRAPAKRFDLVLALHDNPDKKKDLVKTEELVWVTSHKHNAQNQDTVPLIVAPNGCIYRNRGIECLNSTQQKWRIVYTIPDLAGINAAIEEGLGVTILTKSTVPDNLHIIKPCQKFPNLGEIGISLEYTKKNCAEATQRLIHFVQTNLT